MKVVLTGGSGLLGRALVDSLSADGIDCVVLSRSPERVRDLPRGAVAARWDGGDAEALRPLVEGAAAVVNLAGENIGGGRWTAERKKRIRESRILATGAVVDALSRVGDRPATLLQGSAIGFYGTSGDEELEESAPGGEDFLAGVCRDWEEASAAAERSGVRRVVLRTGVVLAAEGGALPRMALPFRLFAGGRAGSGRQWLSWIHLRDHVRAMRFLLENGDAAGAFNLSAPKPVRNAEMAATLGRVMARPSLLPAPALALKLILGEMATLVLDGQRAIPARLVELGFDFEFRELEPALRDLLG